MYFRCDKLYDDDVDDDDDYDDILCTKGVLMLNDFIE